VTNDIASIDRLSAGPHPDYEIDHLIPICLGGGSDDFSNPWPQPRQTIEPKRNAEAKDRLERLIREIVCSGQLDTATAQEAFAKDWIAAYQKPISCLHTRCVTASLMQAMGIISRLGSKPASAIVNQKPGYDRARYIRATIFEAIPGRRSASHN
jgi:hypothetical protein